MTRAMRQFIINYVYMAFISDLHILMYYVVLYLKHIRERDLSTAIIFIQ